MSVAATRIIATALITFTVVFAAERASCSETATPDDTARFLAGLRPSPNSPPAARTNDPVWISHAQRFDSIFAREENTHLSKIREFSEKYLTTKHDTVLYMFSGPDFLYATSHCLNIRVSRSRTSGKNTRAGEPQPFCRQWRTAKS